MSTKRLYGPPALGCFDFTNDRNTYVLAWSAATGTMSSTTDLSELVFCGELQVVPCRVPHWHTVILFLWQQSFQELPELVRTYHVMQGGAPGQEELQQQRNISAAADRQAEVDSESEDAGQQKGKKGKRDRGKGQHKVPKRQKASSTGSFFADLL